MPKVPQKGVLTQNKNMGRFRQTWVDMYKMSELVGG